MHSLSSKYYHDNILDASLFSLQSNIHMEQ
jgi:hypothetical protein